MGLSGKCDEDEDPSSGGVCALVHASQRMSMSGKALLRWWPPGDLTRGLGLG